MLQLYKHMEKRSSELPEIIGLCDRTIIMYEGVVKGEVNWEEMTQEGIMSFASGL